MNRTRGFREDVQQHFFLHGQHEDRCGLNNAAISELPQPQVCLSAYHECRLKLGLCWNYYALLRQPLDEWRESERKVLVFAAGQPIKIAADMQEGCQSCCEGGRFFLSGCLGSRNLFCCLFTWSSELVFLQWTRKQYAFEAVVALSSLHNCATRDGFLWHLWV